MNLLSIETNILFGRQSVLMEDNSFQTLENKNLIHVNNEAYIVVAPDDIVNNGIADIKEELIIPDNIDDYLENKKKIDSYKSLKNESNPSNFINEVSNFTRSPRIWVKDKIQLVEKTELQCKLSTSENEKQKILPGNNEGFCQPMSISQLEANGIYSEENLSVRKSESVRKYIPRIKKKVLLSIDGEKVQGNENQTEFSFNPETQEIKKKILSVDEQSKNKEPHLTDNSEIHKWEKAILPIEENKKQLDRNEVLLIGMDEEQLDRNEKLHIDKYNNKSMCISNKITQESEKEIVDIDKKLSWNGKTSVIQIDLIDTSDDESDESLTEFSPALITNNDSKTINSMMNQQCCKCGTVGESIDIAKGAFCKECEQKLMHRCKICGRIFSFAHSIIQHIIKNHPKKMVIAKSQLQIKESQNVNLEEFTCQECGLTFTTKEQMTLHIFESKTGLEFSCTLCPKKEINRCKLRHHITNDHKGEYKADSLNDIIAHALASTEDKQIAVRIPRYYMNVYCTNCDEKPCLKRRRKALCLNCSQPYILECAECYEVHPSDNSLRKHVIRHHLRKQYYNCTTCPRVFRHSYELQAHQSRCSDEEEYNCPDCPTFCTTSKHSYLFHMRGHRKKTTTNKLKCKYCCKLFANNSTLSKHYRLCCHKNKRLECDDCSWVGLSKKDMLFHLQKNHGKEAREEEMEEKGELEKIIEVEEEKIRVEEIFVEAEEEHRGIEEIIEMKEERRGVEEIIMEVEEEKSDDEEITEVKKEKEEEKKGKQEAEVKVKHRLRKRKTAFTLPRNKKSKH